jgi:Transcriptional regulator containing PAS, AAA-type ATPase, and DNA-binding domains
LKDLRVLQEIWDRFVETGEIDPRLDPTVAKSWQKCRKLGVDPMSGQGKVADETVFRSIQAANKELLDLALPVMRSVYKIVEQSHFLLVLTDGIGYVLEAMGDEAIQKMSKDLSFLKGSLWTDQQVGSNAIGIALDYDTAIQTVGPEHYGRYQHKWTCSAAPIHGPDGQVIGCIDLSGGMQGAHPHTLALVVAAAFSIETMMAQVQSGRMMREALDGSDGSIIILDDRFCPVWMNHAAEKFIGHSAQELAGLDFRKKMPDVDWTQIQSKAQKGRYSSDNARILLKDRTIDCGVSITPTLNAVNRTYTVVLTRQERLIQTVNNISGNRAKYTFDDIFAVDAAMKKTVQLAQKYAQYDGVVLIEGESGTGKELFAQAIHNASSRAAGPFVAVNCASLPRDLIESELFGYEKGAFTGALREGNPGKFELANYGTLFLDEIGEMPLEFQAKMLRAVETLRIRRLGGAQERPLDVRVIAATNRDLRQEAEDGHFRKDLYFRLNVLELNIPPLRERREDIVYCAEKFLERFNCKYPQMKKTMSPEYIHALQEYDWPGNVRELQNSIERTFYACGESELGREDICYVTGQERERETPAEKKSETEYEEVLDALRRSDGNAQAAAQLMNVSRATFYRLCKRYGVEPRKLHRTGTVSV